MAERNNPTHQQQQQRPSRANRTVVPSSTFLQKIQSHAPNTTHFLGFLLLFFVSAVTLLIPTGLTLTATVFGLVCFMPVIVVSSPVWGMHPPGSDRVDSARTRIYDTASHVKDYAMEYGGYLQSKVKDAAPGA
ncbi:hypothetical protein Godav_026175 [Gossypium davidsonii]|uniref:Oleosin n=1 Tax=Gossypium davidsonii TaxID=34287 RepID=A0A7J8RTK9_GOSDV|nr:hypothetical protein [Gossypium davidsonii]